MTAADEGARGAGLFDTAKQRSDSRDAAWRPIEERAAKYIAGLKAADMHRYDRLAAHQDPTLRRGLRDIRRRIHIAGRRTAVLKAHLYALEFKDKPDNTTYNLFNGVILSDVRGVDFFTDAKPIGDVVRGFSALPSAVLSAEAEAEWPVETTRHDVREAYEAEMMDWVGGVNVADDDLDLQEIGWKRMLRRRRGEVLALTTLPADPFDPNLWGHDVRLKSLALTPKVGDSIPLSPAFSAAVFDYEMDYRPDQVLRVDAVAEDARASAREVIGTDKVDAGVTAEDGVTMGPYNVKPSANTDLASLSAKTTGIQDLPQPLTPAFSKEVKAYTSPAAVPLMALTIDARAVAPGARVAVTKSATKIDIVVTAPDGSTTATTTITRATG